MKYIGSKSKIAKYIVPIIQDFIDKNNIKVYVEPFVGGANVIDKIICSRKIGCDIDNIPISLLTKCVQNPNLLKNLPVQVSREYYYEVKRNPDKYPDWYYSAILLFGSYNNRVYGGCYGAMAKTKDGTIRNYFAESIRNFEKQIPNLKGIDFFKFDYNDIKIKNALIYCDPPYANSIKYSQAFDNNAFWQWVRKMSKDNIVVVSEYSAPDDFECIWSMPVKTHLNNRNKLDKVEKLFILTHQHEEEAEWHKE